MTNHKPKVSIGLPVYNGERYLAAAIDSLLAQTYTDFELIISDNASTDRTAEICQEYAELDPRIRYYRQPKNCGIAGNFTQTFELARGEFFQWHAHDDICGPTLLARSVEMLDRNPEAVLCYARPAIIDEYGELSPDDPATWRPSRGSDGPFQIVHETLAKVAADNDRRGLDSPSASRRFYGVLLNTVWCLESYGMIRTAVMRTTGKLRGYRAAEKVFLAEMALRGQFAEIPEILFFVRRHAEQYTMLPSGSAQRDSVKRQWSGLRWPMPRQVRSTLGYLLLVPAAPIGWIDRLRCLGVWWRYVFQVGKWKRIFVNTVRDVGITDGYVQLPQSKPTVDISEELVRTPQQESRAPVGTI
ncbi:MAG TPA: glycosyltransferase family 2 protein [Pirellulales bacterium]|jgi:glycosyltransferase involved in cell wall biosynthesis